MSKQIDPRGPRFGAAITTVLLATTIYLALDANSLNAAFWLLVAITACLLSAQSSETRCTHTAGSTANLCSLDSVSQKNSKMPQRHSSLKR